jgi:nickel-dependent lactate racemase
LDDGVELTPGAPMTTRISAAESESERMRIRLAYGRDGLDIDLPDRAYVIEPLDPPALPDERGAFEEAVRAPLHARPLSEQIAAKDTVVIVTSDVTRATPNERLIPWILDELAHVPAAQISVIVGTGSHRTTTPAEMVAMFGQATLDRVRVIDHDAHDPAQSTLVGETSLGAPVFLNTEYVKADKRIVVGFIEPHLYAGFSGGPKGVMPGIAGIETVNFFHNARMIGDPDTRWLNLEWSPVQAMAREVAALAPPDFLVNVTLDRQRRITGFFCGNYLSAHRAGCAFCMETATHEVPYRFDVVVTTNGGYPLDQNLYQCIKGLSAAQQIVKPGGTIVLCAECSDGFPEHGNFKDIVRERTTPQELLAMIEAPGYSRYDQWAAHSQALVLMHARVAIKSTLPDDLIRAAMLEPVSDPAAAVREALAHAGAGASCAVLPEGPYVIPFATDPSGVCGA